ncbi:hypothetical protein YC2023_109060 [Brassica napus]
MYRSKIDRCRDIRHATFGFSRLKTQGQAKLPKFPDDDGATVLAHGSTEPALPDSNSFRPHLELSLCVLDFNKSFWFMLCRRLNLVLNPSPNPKSLKTIYEAREDVT